jgi:hypothetical protein
MTSKIFYLTYSFDPEQDRWVLIASMKSKRLAVGVAVVNRLVNGKKFKPCHDDRNDKL